MNRPIAFSSGRAARGGRDELARQLRGHVLVVLVAQVILEGDDRTDEARGLGLEGLAHELQGVAEPLRGDPQLVEGGQVRRLEVSVERPDVLVGAPDRGGHAVAHEPGGVGGRTRAARPGVPANAW